MQGNRGGQGRGQNQGRGPGRGKGGGNRPGSGPGGNCKCPNCGATAPHQQGVPCYTLECSNCGAKMMKQ